ncbi:MAG: hypothetical protein ABSB42_05580 [Tepidisphaeraceae bacterium]
MIRAAGWYCKEHCGVVAAKGLSWQKPAPSAPADMLALVGRPIKYFARMTGEARCCLCAASLALKGADWWESFPLAPGFAGVSRDERSATNVGREDRSILAQTPAEPGANGKRQPPQEIGLLSAGSEGLLRANQEYFRDYVAMGRTLGRGNLFIYTLATSALGEVAIGLSLTGPSMFIQDDARPVTAMLRHGEQMVADGEAGGMLALWSHSSAAVCLAIAAGAGGETSIPLPAGEERNPLELCRTLQRMVT